MSRITGDEWTRYITRLREIDERAANEMKMWVADSLKQGMNVYWERDLVVAKAYALATKYGEASAALAAEMYDAIAMLEGANLMPAVPAATATPDVAAKATLGTLKHSTNVDSLAGTVSRLVRQAGQDTMMQNAVRDGAEWAWIPSGDTCPYCIAFAAAGWQKADKPVVDHIHGNCDCAVGVRHTKSTEFASYNPDKYHKLYYGVNIDGYKNTSKNRINALRREQYAEKKDEINAQKRAAYAKRKEADE